MKKLLIVSLILCLLAVGCSRKAAGDTEIQTVAQQTQEDSDNPLPKTNGDTLNIGMPTGITVFHPLDTRRAVMVNLLGLSFDSLFAIGAQGKLEGQLVESYAYENGIYRLTLRSGVSFHNGKKLTANDVKYTVTQLKKEGDPSQARNTIYANAKAVIQEVNVTGELTLTMKLKPGGMSPLHTLLFPILPADGSNNGTGAYKMTAAGSGGITFEAFAESWRKQPGIRRIQALPFADEEQISKAYKENRVDVVLVDHGSLGLYKYTPHTKTRSARTNNYYYLIPNITSGKMANSGLRQALGYGIDREKVVARAFDSSAVLSDYPIPSDYAIFDNELPSYSHDVGRCLRLFGEQGYAQTKEGTKTYLRKDKNNLTLKVVGLVTSDLYHQNIAHTLQSQLAEIGVVVEVELLQQEEYDKAIQNGRYDLAIAHTQISSEFNLEYLLGAGGSKNLNKYKSPEVAAGLNQIANAGGDMGALKQGYTKIQTELIKKLPQYGLCFTTDTLVYNDRIKGVDRTQNYNMLGGIVNWSFKKVDETVSTVVVD